MSDAYRRRDTSAQPQDVPPDGAGRRRPPPGGAPRPEDGGDGALRAVPPLPVADEDTPRAPSARHGADPADGRGRPVPGAERGVGHAAGADGPAPTVPDRTEVEQAVPLVEQLRTRAADLSSIVRSSIPIRTMLFVLPPFVLPPLAFDLSIAETFVVALVLLWLAAAAAVLASIIVDGTDQVALRAIDRRLAQLTERRGDETSEALLAIGGQLDRLTDRVERLAAAVGPRPPATRSAPPRPPQPAPRPWQPARGPDPRAADPRW